MLDWKHNPVTQEMFIEIRRRIEGLRDEMEDGALSAEPRQLAFRAGAIAAFRDVLDIVSFLEETE